MDRYNTPAVMPIRNKKSRFFVRNEVLSPSPYSPPALPYGMEHSTSHLLSRSLTTIFDWNPAQVRELTTYWLQSSIKKSGFIIFRDNHHGSILCCFQRLDAFYFITV